MRRGVTILLATALFLVSEMAWAESPEESVRVPMTFAERFFSPQVIVEPGDHLWKISARYLAEVDSESPIAPYWREVIDENLPTLRSGNPDLIYPGETVRLPQPSRLGG